MSNDMPGPITPDRSPIDATAEDGIANGLNRLSMEQALLDVEVANKRVAELTQRLIWADQQLTELRAESPTLKRLRRVLYLVARARAELRAFRR